MARTFSWPIRVYWEDTDAGGVVYYANYLRFMERARSEWLRARGIDQAALTREERLQFIVVEVQLRYRMPARHDDQLVVSASLTKWRGASLTFDQEVRRAGDGGALLVAATVRAACVDCDSFKPRPLPASLLEELKREL